MTKSQKARNRKNPKPYETYALAEEAVRDPETGAARPSEENVIIMREWSEENKL